MVLRINHVAPDMHGTTDQPIPMPPGILLRSVFVALIVATSFAAAGMLLSRTNSGEVRVFDPRCQHLDSAAAMHLAKLISDRSQATQMQVRSRLIRLRRARRNCAYDDFISARRDYDAIIAMRGGR